MQQNLNIAFAHIAEGQVFTIYSIKDELQKSGGDRIISLTKEIERQNHLRDELRGSKPFYKQNLNITLSKKQPVGEHQKSLKPLKQYQI